MPNGNDVSRLLLLPIGEPSEYTFVARATGDESASSGEDGVMKATATDDDDGPASFSANAWVQLVHGERVRMDAIPEGHVASLVSLKPGNVVWSCLASPPLRPRPPPWPPSSLCLLRGRRPPVVPPEKLKE
ncbi:hypothetical protein MMPV_000291 [Pyropia vietnamensis]